MDATISPMNRIFHQTSVCVILSSMSWSLFVIFLLGVANFALHSAVLRSGHSLIDQMPGVIHALGGRLTLIAEFVVLLVAMLLAANGWQSLAWVYAGYTGLNAVSAWLILSGRV